MSTRFNPLLLAAALSLAPMALAQDAFIVGVCSHELHRGQPDSPANRLMQRAGIESVRTDAHWAYVERQRDQLEIERHWYRYLEDTQASGLQSLFILGYGNSFHAEGQKPRSEPVRAAFNRYVGFVGEALKGQVSFYEVWNEWDVEDPVSPAFTEDYARLVADADGIIRERDPQARVLAGAVTSLGIESGFARRLIDNGVLNSVDGLSLHPYVHCRGRGRNTPEAWIDWLDDVDRELTLAAGRPVPLYLTEMAWPSHQGACGVDEQTQAAYLARSFFLARTLPSIRGMWWYDLRNDGTDRREREHNFGLLRHDYQPKPAYRVLTAISPIVRDYEYLGQERRRSRDVFLLRFRHEGDEVLVGWSAGEPTSLLLEAPAARRGRLQLIDTAQPLLGRHSGQAQWNCPADGSACSVKVELGAFPKVFSLNPLAEGGE